MPVGATAQEIRQVLALDDRQWRRLLALVEAQPDRIIGLREACTILNMSARQFHYKRQRLAALGLVIRRSGKKLVFSARQVSRFASELIERGWEV